MKTVTEGNDAVFARLVQNLYDDLEFVRRELACKLADAASGQPPITASVCNTLASKWANGKIKLDKLYQCGFPAEAEHRRPELPVVPHPADQLPVRDTGDDAHARHRKPGRRAQDAR